MSRYRAEVQVWPHSTGRGQDVDQKEAGDRVQTIEVIGDDMGKAMEKIDIFCRGLCANPMVWQAPIYKIERVG